MKHIRIEGKRWFQTTYGNTYHSVKVFYNGNLLEYMPFEYGYGNQYLQAAQIILRKHLCCLASSATDMLKSFQIVKEKLEERGYTFTITCLDVPRRKDL